MLLGVCSQESYFFWLNKQLHAGLFVEMLRGVPDAKSVSTLRPAVFAPDAHSIS